MSISTLLDKHVTLVYATVTGTDDYNQPVLSESTADAACYYRLMSTDDVDALSREQIDYKMYLSITVDVIGLVAVDMDGARYEVQGPAHKQWNPRLSRHEFWVLSVRRAV